MINLSFHDKETLFIGAFRYYLGRRTYAVGDFTRLLKKVWKDLDKNTKQIIEKELSKAIEKDNEQRLLDSNYYCLGMDCDKADWINLYEYIKQI